MYVHFVNPSINFPPFTQIRTMLIDYYSRNYCYIHQASLSVLVLFIFWWKRPHIPFCLLLRRSFYWAHKTVPWWSRNIRIITNGSDCSMSHVSRSCAGRRLAIFDSVAIFHLLIGSVTAEVRCEVKSLSAWITTNNSISTETCTHKHSVSFL